MKKNNFSYELDLFKNIFIYLIFYILFLELINLETLMQNKLLKLLLKINTRSKKLLIIIKTLSFTLLNKKYLKKYLGVSGIFRLPEIFFINLKFSG